ncbi:MAG: penicillin acylase family protein [Halobacteria archaeon]|nr:penicillin acylase family protein [Halobacteria archaeon]
MSTEMKDAETTVETPEGEVEILTDDYNVSHIYGKDLYSVAYANGYVQARDRLFEMDVLRHVGYGDSASVIGPSQLASDIQVRRDLYDEDEIVEQIKDAYDEMREALRGFAAGVNRRIEEMRDSNNLPAEFTALGHDPEEWTPEDSIAIVNYLIGFFGVEGGEEVENARKYARLCESMSDEKAYEAYGDLNWLRIPDDHYTSIPRDDLEVELELGSEVLDFDDVPQKQIELAKAARDAEPWGIEDKIDVPNSLAKGLRNGLGKFKGFKWGSNALVVDGEKTETGKPMMFGGPQMGYFKPPVIHEIGLHGADFDVAGVDVRRWRRRRRNARSGNWQDAKLRLERHERLRRPDRHARRGVASRRQAQV